MLLLERLQTIKYTLTVNKENQCV